MDGHNRDVFCTEFSQVYKLSHACSVEFKSIEFGGCGASGELPFFLQPVSCYPQKMGCCVILLEKAIHRLPENVTSKKLTHTNICACYSCENEPQFSLLSLLIKTEHRLYGAVKCLHHMLLKRWVHNLPRSPPFTNSTVCQQLRSSLA